MALVGWTLRILHRPLYRCLTSRSPLSSEQCPPDSDPAVLELQNLELTKFRPLPPPHGSVQSYARHSSSLQHLLRMGVNLYILSQRPEVISFVMRADFDADIAPIVQFLAREFCLDLSQIATIITKCPAVLLDGEVARMAALKRYLAEVGFEPEDMTRLAAGNAAILVTPPEELDYFMELLQQTFMLTGSEVRQLVLADPLTLSVPPNEVRMMAGTYRKSLGFSLRELHLCVTTAPLLLRSDPARSCQNFALLHNRYRLQHGLLAANAEVFAVDFRHLRERLHFLRASGRAQFDANRPLFTPPRILAAKSDEEFCALVPGGVDIESYNEFLRSM